MQAGFGTESLSHARAALLLYAMYRSRGKESSLNGLETWDRCAAYIRGAVLKSSTVAEFVQNFCKKAAIGSIVPRYLETTGFVPIDDVGTLAKVDGVYDYQLDIFQDDKVLKIFANEAQYIIMLVREKIQREKELFTDYEADDQI